ncbi:hypothetical protein HJC23_007559 [Cyclotella cryptica]|uniref:Prenyltransferase alpha-alpha toroid domain-containing protein n=1 Tax=Cyclotella cryptica TaxID=29204 RepID=A0ABD3QQR9_9STRA|eukprot:CCRYP_002820-RA/>CCRYP_002820-RA protein AED:0.27 eAED:0.27 QI:0/-1/0/1/-1/1/1/0/454
MKKFERLRHIRYFTNSLQNLPKQYSSADTNRLTLVHFCIQSLDILGVLPDYSSDVKCCRNVNEDVYLNRDEIVEWIYGLQTLPTIVENFDRSVSPCSKATPQYAGGGFKGSNYLGPTRPAGPSNPYDHSHLAMTYVALCTLIALGDDLSRVNREAILSTLRGLQKDNGSFLALSSNDVGGEYVKEDDDDCDLRFMYTAICIWYILADESPNNKNSSHSADACINIEAATSYILSCVTYEGSLGLTPGREGHGGSTFCGIASLFLMGVLDDVLQRPEQRGWKEDVIRWCVMRQNSLPGTGVDSDSINNGYDGENGNAAGMQGRPNKLEDTCYSYWIGGTLHLLGAAHLLDGWALREYVLKCQSPYGGFGKVVGAMPDLLHSFYSMAWLALSEEGGGCIDDTYQGMIGEQTKTTVSYSDVYAQVAESITQLSRLDCALGMCAKRLSMSKTLASLDP